MNNTLFIKSIDRCLSSSLSSSTFFDNGVSLSTGITFETIDIIGIPSLEISKKIENNQEVTTSSVAFYTASALISPNSLYSYRLTLMDGTQLLIGSASRPYAICEETTTRASSPASSNISSYTISYISQYSPYYIV